MAGFVEYRAKLIMRQKALANADTKMTITVGEFMRHMERAYDAGVTDANDSDQGYKLYTSSAFEEIFGGLNNR